VCQQVQVHTHPLEEGVEDSAWRGVVPRDGGEGGGGGQQRDEARRAALCAQPYAVEEGPAVQLHTTPRHTGGRRGTARWGVKEMEK